MGCGGNKIVASADIKEVWCLSFDLSFKKGTRFLLGSDVEMVAGSKMTAAAGAACCPVDLLSPTHMICTCFLICGHGREVRDSRFAVRSNVIVVRNCFLVNLR